VFTISIYCFAGIEDVDAVISTIGGTTKNPQADSQGNINIIQAAAKKGVKKFILVTSIGCGDTKDAPGEQVYKVLEPVLLEKNKAEEVLKVRWGLGFRV
jgi:nucleoside-diphosphate-sugar epimerase